MVRTLFPGHRRYSITHRAVQRLRELVQTLGDDDDELLRDRLDAAITDAEDSGKAIRTLDVMLGEPQVLTPLESFGEVLYAIIKEDTVVTVLPRSHGEEILLRGQALEQKVATGAIPPVVDDQERWEQRRRWRRDAAPPVIERVDRLPRGGAHPIHEEGTAANEPPDAPPAVSPAAEALLSRALEEATQRLRGRVRLVGSSAPARAPTSSPVVSALTRGVERAERRAAIAALADTLSAQPQAELLPLWNSLLEQGLPESLTVQDLIQAVRQADAQGRA
jgi:hypothetical protein